MFQASCRLQHAASPRLAHGLRAPGAGQQGPGRLRPGRVAHRLVAGQRPGGQVAAGLPVAAPQRQLGQAAQRGRPVPLVLHGQGGAERLGEQPGRRLVLVLRGPRLGQGQQRLRAAQRVTEPGEPGAGRLGQLGGRRGPALGRGQRGLAGQRVGLAAGVPDSPEHLQRSLERPRGGIVASPGH